VKKIKAKTAGGVSLALLLSFYIIIFYSWVLFQVIQKLPVHLFKRSSIV